MGYVLTDNHAWVLKDQVGAHVEEEHDEVKELNIGDDNEFADMFETSSTTSLFEDDDPSS